LLTVTYGVVRRLLSNRLKIVLHPSTLLLGGHQVPKLDSRGFTLIEALVVLGAVGVLFLIGYPKIRSAMTKANVRSARSSVITLYNQARNRAVREGRSMTLHFSNSSGTAWMTGSPRRASGTATCGCDTVGTIQYLNGAYGVTITPTPDTFRIDPRGLGVQPSASGTVITLAKLGYQDSVLISGYGRVSK
jgi:prepilin-type N-terminal cleavage/methylation domain-containing protein